MEIRSHPFINDEENVPSVPPPESAGERFGLDNAEYQFKPANDYQQLMRAGEDAPTQHFTAVFGPTNIRL